MTTRRNILKMCNRNYPRARWLDGYCVAFADTGMPLLVKLIPRLRPIVISQEYCIHLTNTHTQTLASAPCAGTKRWRRSAMPSLWRPPPKRLTCIRRIIVTRFCTCSTIRPSSAITRRYVFVPFFRTCFFFVWFASDVLGFRTCWCMGGIGYIPHWHVRASCWRNASAPKSLIPVIETHGGFEMMCAVWASGT